MKPFVPAFDALWRGSKAGLSHATRSIFLRLCQEVRDAKRRGEIALPPARTDLEALLLVVPATRAEMKAALSEMTLTNDPMVTIEMVEGRRVLRVLSWAEWALIDKGPASPADQTPQSEDTRPRKWASEAERKRAARAAVRTAKRTRPDDRVDTRPDEADGEADASGRSGGHSSGRVGGGKGGALPPFQKREEEIKVEEITGEGEARASARGTPPASTRKGRLLASLRQSSDLAELEATKQLDLERVARDLGDNGANYVIGGKLREDEVDERLDAVVRDLVREAAAAASTSRPMPPLEVARKAHTFATATLGKSREEWGKRQSQTTGTPGQGEDLRRVIDIFASMWSARKKRDYVQADGAERHAQKLVDAARQNASKRAGLQPSAIVRHWVSQYLADVSDRKIVDEEHPLSFLPSRIDRYGLPKSEKPPVPQAKTNVAPETASGPAPLDMLKRLQQPSNDVDSMMTRPSAPRAGGT